MDKRTNETPHPHGPADAPLSLRIAPPATLGRLVRRDRLLRALRDALDRSIVLLQAPAGFGKTYLLADAHARLARNGVRTAWLTLRAGYADDRDFATELAHACGVEGGSPGDAEGLAEERLAEMLRGRQATTVVMLDQCDDAIDPVTWAVLDRLVHRTPEQVRFVLSSRGRLDCPALSTLLLRGAVARIGWEALRLTDAETLAMLPAAAGPQLAERIAAFAAGWPAAVTLAGIAMAADGDGRQLENLLAGSFAPLRQYVADVVAAAREPYLHSAFLLAGFVDAVSHELVAAFDPGRAAPETDRDVLDELEPLVSPLPGRDGWYRPHPALAAVSRHRFSRLGRQERSRLHAEAARWFAANGHLQEAVHHAVETGDYRLAESAIREAGGVRIFLRSGFPTLYRLLSQLPTQVILDSAGLQLCQAVVYGKHGQLEPARELVDDVKRAIQAGEAVDVLPEDVAQIDSLISIYDDNIGRPEVVAELERDARALPPRELWRIAWAANHLCIGHTVLGEFEKAESEALKALTLYREEDMRYAQIFMLIHLGLIAVSKGKPLSALNFVAEGQALIDRGQRGDRHLQAILNVPAAEIHYVRGEADRACALAEEALPWLQTGEAWVDIFARAYQTRVRIAVSRNETRHALRILDAAEQVAHQRHLGRLMTLATLLRLEVMMRTGLTEAAEDIASSIGWLTEPGAGPGTSAQAGGAGPSWRERHLALQLMARIHWSRGQPEAALAMLDRLEGSAKAIGAGLDLTAARALRFCFLWHMKRAEEARESFQLAVALATPQRLISVFADETYMMAVAIRGILRRFGASAFSHATIEFTNTILGTYFEMTPDRDAARRSGGVKILITDHEREILEHLSMGLSNKEIARKIGRTEATVKYHLRRVYSKLGVRSRAMALVMARKASLIVPSETMAMASAAEAARERG